MNDNNIFAPGMLVHIADLGMMGTVTSIEAGQTRRHDVLIVRLSDGRWAAVPVENAEMLT